MSTVPDVYLLTLTQMKTLTPMLLPRGDFAAVAVGKLLIAIGGYNFESDVVFAHCEVLTDNKWKFLPSLQVPRRSSSAVEFKACIFVFGGDGLDTVESFALNDKSWKLNTLKLPTAAKNLALCKLDDSRLLVLGGTDKQGLSLTEVMQFKSEKLWKYLKPLTTPTKTSVPPLVLEDEVLLFDEDIAVKYSLAEGNDILPLSNLPIPTSPRIDLTDNTEIEETEAAFNSGVFKVKPFSTRLYRYFLNPNPAILVIKRIGFDIDCIEGYKKVVTLLIKLGCVVYSEASCLGIVEGCNLLNESALHSINLIVTIGGDGTAIWASGLFRLTNMPPIVCFNLVTSKQGSLGFLTRYKIEEYEEVLTEILLRDSFQVDVSNRLEAWVESNDIKEYKGQAANELCVDRGPSPSMLGVEISLNGIPMTTAYGDGLIVSTPLGSTGYSLSAGGSIVHPDVPGILITPICPHSLSFRPVLLPDSSEVRLTIPNTSRSDAWVGIDGQTRFLLPINSTLIIRMSSYPIPRKIQSDVELRQSIPRWIEKLSTELMWNKRVSQKQLGLNAKL